jgi:hypothetical protein
MNVFTTPTMTETVSGLIIDLADPKPEDIRVDDIAWSLSRQSRYAGHTMSRIPYTVAQHTVMVSRYIEEALTPDTDLNTVFHEYLASKSLGESAPHEFYELEKFVNVMCEDHIRMFAFQGLMHDFAEAYLVDLPTPVKHLPGVYEAYKAAELKMDALIYETLGLGYSANRFPAMWKAAQTIVAWADMYALLVEAYHFMPSRGLNWGVPLPRPSLTQIYKFRWPISNEEAYHELLARYEELKPPPPTY